MGSSLKNHDVAGKLHTSASVADAELAPSSGFTARTGGGANAWQTSGANAKPGGSSSPMLPHRRRCLCASIKAVESRAVPAPRLTPVTMSLQPGRAASASSMTGAADSSTPLADHAMPQKATRLLEPLRGKLSAAQGVGLRVDASGKGTRHGCKSVSRSASESVPRMASTMALRGSSTNTKCAGSSGRARGDANRSACGGMPANRQAAAESPRSAALSTAPQVGPPGLVGSTSRKNANPFQPNAAFANRSEQVASWSSAAPGHGKPPL